MIRFNVPTYVIEYDNWDMRIAFTENEVAEWLSDHLMDNPEFADWDDEKFEKYIHDNLDKLFDDYYNDIKDDYAEQVREEKRSGGW